MNGSDNLILISLAVCSWVLSFLIVYIIARIAVKDKIAMRNRLKLIVNKEEKNKYIEKDKKMQKSKADKKFFDLKIFDFLSNELLLANIMMKPEEFMLIWLIVVFVPGGLVALLSRKIIPAFTLIGMGAILPPVYIKSRKHKRLISFENQLGDALVIMSNCIRSGLTFQQALENISQEMPDPISREFARVVREIKYGNSVEKALNHMAERIKSPDLLLTVSAVLIQRQVGGNLSVILDTISKTIKERTKIKNEIRVLTATGRISGTVIGLLPVAIGLILLLLNPEYIELFFTTQIGTALLIAAGVLELIGFLVVKKMVSVKY